MCWFTRKCVVDGPGSQLGGPRWTESGPDHQWAQRDQQCAGSSMRGHAAMAEHAGSLMCVKCAEGVIQSGNATVGQEGESTRSGCDFEHHYPSCCVGLVIPSCILCTVSVKILEVNHPEIKQADMANIREWGFRYTVR